MEITRYRMRLEIRDDDGVYKEIAILERDLPAGVGRVLLETVTTACEAIEKRENLPGPEGGLSQ